ncbi:MAG: transporter [Caulobacter sp.]|nr:transporter [Caulobacter sp.]
MAQPGPAPTFAPDAKQTSAAGAATGVLVVFVVALFFAWGFATVMIDTLIPKLKGLFALSYAQVMLTQFAFFIAYFIFSIPAGILLSRIGYLRGIVVGLVVMAAGCLMFSPAASAGVYWGFLVALFVMAAGVTTLQVAANPLIAIIGKPGASAFRLNLAQTFNSLGTFIGPFVGAAIILKGGVTPPDPAKTAPDVMAVYRVTEAHAVQAPFLGIAAGLVLLGVIFWFLRKSAGVPTPAKNETSFASFALLARPRLAFGALCIFLYVGAEVSIGSLMVNYLSQPHVLAISVQAAGKLVAFYWGGAMVGRLIGSLLLYLKAPAARLLSLCALGAIALVVLSSMTSGSVAGYAIIAVGLVNSIMFPTIFTLGIEGMGDKTPQASSLLCMAIVGGAIIPLITGKAADMVGLGLALLVPAACYLVIAAYGLYAHSRKLTDENAPVAVAP